MLPFCKSHLRNIKAILQWLGLGSHKVKDQRGRQKWVVFSAIFTHEQFQLYAENTEKVSQDSGKCLSHTYSFRGNHYRHN